MLDLELDILPLDILHNQVMDIAFIVDIVCPNDVAVVQRRSSTGFYMKSGQVRGVFYAVLGQDFDGHSPLHQHVFGKINGAHTAGSQMVEQLILA